MNRNLINKAQTELEGLLAHGTGEMDILSQFNGDCDAAAKFVANYAAETGNDLDEENCKNYFEYVKSNQ
jgi:hypothetical protein